MPTNPLETPIERIFREVMGREMPISIKDVLLGESSARLNDGSSSQVQSGEDSPPAKKKTPRPSNPNLLDYPNSMSQREKESLLAEARHLSDKLKTKRGTRRKPPNSIN